MIKLKDLLVKEGKETAAPVDLVSITDDVIKFFGKNKKSLEKLAKDDNWKEFYAKGFEEFPDAKQDDVAQAMNKAAGMEGFFANKEVPTMPTEKELKDKAFGKASDLGKGIKTSEYDKKQKLPKSKKEDLVTPMKESKKPSTKKRSFISEGVFSELDIIAQESPTLIEFLKNVKDSYPDIVHDAEAIKYLGFLYKESKKSKK